MLDIRWKQRYENFSLAFSQLAEFLEQETLNKFEAQGLIQCFEYTFELGWKTLKDYLESEGFDVKTPRSTIQTAFQAEFIPDGHVWIDMLEKRNLMAHTYNERFAAIAEQLIRNEYYTALKNLHAALRDRI
ncbi:nucleotidyltransferase substrate binding protein [Paenibacillus sp. IB182496]|uniref:Nucleotidyltransferase substrate binding protein n=1 Tax=Paenibacillus sabuli TaxID=2772509 RepID=A0A927BYS8_9BACL|nr:nucleotidyltransferase substrate binding protein [Paenibacillus sabuli]MBD2847793.1 nucleotidyltransferase substrate binding protein [Paenibacillus sabuli]